MRLKAMRRGLQDLEYATMVEESDRKSHRRSSSWQEDCAWPTKGMLRTTFCQAGQGYW
jgi:hypothetical protein